MSGGTNETEAKETPFGPVIVAAANSARAFDAPVRYPVIFAAPGAFEKVMAFPKMSAFVTLIEHFFGVVILFPILLTIKGLKELNGDLSLKHKLSSLFKALSIGIRRFIEKLKSLSGKDWGAIAYISIGGSALGLFFYLISFALGSVTEAIIVQNLQPLITFIFAIALLREKPSIVFYPVLVSSLTGLILLSFPQILNAKNAGDVNGLLSILFSLLAAIMWGGSTVFGRMLTRKMNYWEITLVRYIGGFIFLILLNIPLLTYSSTYFNLLDDKLHVFGYFDESTGLYKPLSIQIPMIVGIIYFAIFTGGILPLALYYFGLKRSKAAIAGIAELAFPVLSIFVNYYFLNMGLTLIQIIGSIIIFVSIAVLSYSNAKELEKRMKRENLAL